MAIPELTLRKAKKELADFCDSRIPAHVRHEIRLEVDFTEGVATMYECHPPWSPEWTEWSRVGVARFRFSNRDRRWRLYWSDRNGRWHLYDPIEPAPELSPLLAEVDRDPTHIFWG
jgi:hypothetical protein